jgi:hypothetical protein
MCVSIRHDQLLGPPLPPSLPPIYLAYEEDGNLCVYINMLLYVQFDQIKNDSSAFVLNDDWSMDHILLWAASAPPTSGSWSLGVAGTIHDAFHFYTVLGELVDTLRRQLLIEL